ncbi:cellulase family glycosylhydrolase [Brevundimonas sp. NPDC092305]|uniref:cellulase family glycosylhydrolase n=1 Tax=Brevundimonas sp. NPDC092305 TaxID=3363957 RepID=UPI00380C2A85
MIRTTGAALGAALTMLSATPASAQDWLRTDGTRIVDESGRTVILRGMGLGGWMLQEGYMLQLSALGQQHVIRARIEDLIGPEKTEAFYEAWRENHTTKADIDAMARWGFNSVRLPIHYDQLTLPVDQEPVAGQDTWHEAGFERIDELLSWTKANGIHLILDLHAAPGGQGNDLAISDRDPAKPPLWDSPENRRKTVALWRRLAERYADEPGIGGYDLINEPNWNFDTAGLGNGCAETRNEAVWALQREITAAIREVDRRHLIVVEGNCWGNNYKGLPALWDDNLVLSFHKYWNRNNAASIADITRLRDERNAPVWLGESGENSNVWFRDAIALVEGEGIGWAFWPLKKIGFNQPLEIAANPGWAKLVAYWTADGPRPTAEEAEAALMTLATRDIRYEHNIQHPDVIDAMLRQPHSDAARPFADHRIGAGGVTIRAVDYDMGPAGVAWFDTHDADYKGPRERVWWNTGRTLRNDGVDIAREAGEPVVAEFVDGEWLRYTVEAEGAGGRSVSVRLKSSGEARVSVAVNGGVPVEMTLPAGDGDAWRDLRTTALPLLEGRNTIVLRAERCDCRVESLRID